MEDVEDEEAPKCCRRTCPVCGEVFVHHIECNRRKKHRVQLDKTAPCNPCIDEKTSDSQQEIRAATSRVAGSWGGASKENPRGRTKRQDSSRGQQDEDDSSILRSSRYGGEVPPSMLGQFNQRNSQSRSASPQCENVSSLTYRSRSSGPPNSRRTDVSSASTLTSTLAPLVPGASEHADESATTTRLEPIGPRHLGTSLANPDRITDIMNPQNLLPGQRQARFHLQLNDFHPGPRRSRRMEAEAFPTPGSAQPYAYQLPARDHPMRGALETNDWLEPEEWRLWRGNPPANVTTGAYHTHRKGRYLHARERHTEWAASPLPYEPLQVYIDRLQLHAYGRDLDEYDLEIIQRQWYWRQDHDKALRFPDVPRDMRERKQKTRDSKIASRYELGFDPPSQGPSSLHG